ncbi:ketopantoate reductase family protein [Paenibacillus guangzhouensis]|uniref:ketopantoate reductase family protein n=1 Tax=Paenibacillus guangzhouensis TaxID=1473112 RepID=UPI0012669CF4|nr:2-dehydropantoate 2-reductase [Paenibacillus guangzhouensis]
MNIHIVGAGSLGLLFAGKLGIAGANVTLYPRTEQQSEQLREHGITIITAQDKIEQRTHAVTIQAWDQITADTMVEDGDWILITVKQKHIDDLFIQRLAWLAGQQGYICCYQNGVGHIEWIEQAIDASQVYVAITTEAARRDATGIVTHTGSGNTRIGHLRGSLNEENLENSLMKWLNRAGFSAQVSKNIDMDVYRKLMINAIINPLTAIMRIRNGELLDKPERLQWMKWLYEEIEAVYQANDIYVGAAMWDQVKHVCAATAANTSSMLKDVLAGSDTEIEWINGSILRLAESTELDPIYNRAVYTLVHSLGGPLA